MLQGINLRHGGTVDAIAPPRHEICRSFGQKFIECGHYYFFHARNNQLE